jgi:hypothetical protein
MALGIRERTEHNVGPRDLIGTVEAGAAKLLRVGERSSTSGTPT